MSVGVLVLAFLTGAVAAVPAVGLALGVSAAFGTRYSVLARPWPLLRRALRIGPPRELEAEYPPRFAQLLGASGLALASALFAAGVPVAGWAIAGAVAALQAVLASTGYCLGCRLYFLRWYAPRLFDRLIGGSSPGPASEPAG